MHPMKYNETQIIKITFMAYFMICINCILMGAFVGWYIEYKNMHSMGNIKLTYCHIFEEMYLKKKNIIPN